MVFTNQVTGIVRFGTPIKHLVGLAGGYAQDGLNKG